jgi:hypothetical protein
MTSAPEVLHTDWAARELAGKVQVSLQPSVGETFTWSTDLYWVLGNCDIDFFNFRHRQVRNFKILDLFKWNWNFAVIFQKYQKRNQKSTKYFATSQKPSIIPLKFREISVVSWNPINYCEILQFLVKFGKSPNI